MNQTLTKTAKNDIFPKWDLTDFYASPTDPKFLQDFTKLEEEVKKFVAKWEGNLQTSTEYTDDKSLGHAVQEYETIVELAYKISSYVYLNYALNVSDPERSRLLSDTQSKITKIFTSLIFFELELNKLNEENLKTAEKDKLFKKYLPWINKIRKNKPHQLNDDLERLFSETSLTGYAAWNRLYNDTLSKSRYLVDNEELTLEQTLDLLQNKEENKRKAAFYALKESFEKDLPIYSLITNVLAQEKEISDRWHKFEDVASSRHLENSIDPEMVEALVNTVKANYPAISHRYYAIKAKLLGKEKLNAWDRNAPLGDAKNEYISWKEAEKIVLEAYEQFSPKLAELGKKFFGNGWIDAESTPGKKSGAFAHSTVPSVHPYLLLNYLGSSRDVMTLAHELGHGVHQLLAAPQGVLMASTPLTLAETASVFGEMLTFQSLLNKQTDLKQRQIFLAKKVEDMINTVVRQISFYLFEREVHETRRSEGELSNEKIGQIWLKTQKESLGEAIEITEDYANFWTYIGHFIHSPFYVYAYAFGDGLVNSLYSAYQQGQENFKENYFKLLEAGGSKSHEELLDMFGFDASKASFWEKGLSTIINMIDEIEEIENKINR
ncbi:M3 family oligoendopeptidase [Bartonella sp. DGB1]|uniref:M3 family oligoendopeptidase n=1 Tax=Bartonella sp. DGB1 TaxID=3239807 RepID=UPI003523FC96